MNRNLFSSPLFAFPTKKQNRKSTLPVWAAVALFLFFHGTILLAGTTYYVSTSGSDSASGSSTKPFKTINKAASVAHAGDTVNVRSGVYKQLVRISSRGISTAWTKSMAPLLPGCHPDGSGTSDTSLVSISGKYVVFKNFEVRYASRSGVSVGNTNNVRIEGNSIHNSVRGGIYIYASSTGGVTDITVKGNKVYNNCLVNQSHSTSGGWPYALGMHRALRMTVSDNIVYKNQGEGIGIGMTDYALVTGNTVYDNYSVEIYLDNARYSTVDSNMIYSTGDTKYYRSGAPANGITAANENSGTGAYPCNYDKIVNNIVIGGKRGFSYGDYGAGGGIRNSLIANNTFYKATSALLEIDASNHSGTVIQSNIFYQTGTASMAKVPSSGITYRSNCWYGGNPGSASGSGDIKANPQLVSAGGLSPIYYKLTSLSPCIKKAYKSSVVASDYWKAIRSVSYDIGAHEFSLSPD